ncbi:MAG TPA: hypothetical protein VFZ34_07165 [Blastocatellia bacterium]|nr:hypothetical protein [Blastocatellia bacterium]
MNKLPVNQSIDLYPPITIGVLFAFTITIAVIGITAEVAFVTSHLELVARQIGSLTVGGVTH